MANDIRKLFGKKSHTENLFDHFMEIFKAHRGDKEKIRKAEMSLLRPAPIKKFKGPKVERRDFMLRSIRVTLPSHEDIIRWGNHFRVNTYIENNTYDIDFLMFIFKKMEEGRLTWDKENKGFTLHLKNGRRLSI